MSPTPLRMQQRVQPGRERHRFAHAICVNERLGHPKGSGPVRHRVGEVTASGRFVTEPAQRGGIGVRCDSGRLPSWQGRFSDLRRNRWRRYPRCASARESLRRNHPQLDGIEEGIFIVAE